MTELVKKTNIVLIGFMGSGKSLIANELAHRLKKSMVSTDILIQNREGMSIPEVFEDMGEPYFRRKEKEIVKELSKKRNLIMDCGGGIVLDQANIDNLKKKGILFYLYTSPEVIYERVKGEKHRPLLNTENPRATIEGLLTQRKHLYEQADFTIDTSHKTKEQIVEEILKQLPL